MKKSYILAVAILAISIPAFAAKPPAAGRGATVKPVKTSQAPKIKAPKTVNGAAPKARPATAKPAATKPAATKPAKTTTVNATWTPTNPVSQKLSTKPNLLARVTKALPAGTDLNGATAGFKNFGQFIAATNVSTNLGIDFGKLKTAMTGTNVSGVPSGQPTVSLGQAIQRLKPGVDGTAEAARAESLANRQIANDGR
jgi:hypothetical protein